MGVLVAFNIFNMTGIALLFINVVWLMSQWGKRNTESLYISALVDSRALIVIDKSDRILSYSKSFRKLFPLVIKGEAFRSFLNKNKELQEYTEKEFVFKLRGLVYLGRTIEIEELKMFEVINISETLAGGNEVIRRTFEDFDTSPISFVVDKRGFVLSSTLRMRKYWWLLRDHELSHLSDLGIGQNNVELFLYELEQGDYENGSLQVRSMGTEVFDVAASVLNDVSFIVNLSLIGDGSKLAGGHYETMFSILESIDDGLMTVDNSGRIVYTNRQMVNILNSGDLVGLYIHNLVVLNDEWGNEMSLDFPLRSMLYPFTWLTSIFSKERILVEMSVSEVYEGDGFKVGYVFSFRDTSFRDQRHQEVFEFVYTDSMTGVYNRHFFKEEVQRLDNAFIDNFGLLMVDANGLKVVNDAFGHELGDMVITETARILELITRSGDHVVRVGGDEFAVILRDYDAEEVKNLKARLKVEINSIKISHVPLSVSVGYAHHSRGQLNFNDLFSDAEKDMYKDKMLSNKKVKEDILQAIFDELVERNPWERGHSLFSAEAAKAVAMELDLGAEFSDVIYDVGLYHSIGKIGLDLDVYLDGGSLEENQGVYESHNEIAFRILSAMPEHSYMASSILYYNESYDGSGQPKGLVGEDIPLASRIIRVVTTFHKALVPPHEGIGTYNYEQARQHFMAHKGILYDPRVVDAFFGLYDNDIKNKTGLNHYDLV